MNGPVPYLLDSGGPGLDEGLVAFGLALREARWRTKLTQALLEERSGVDQTLISRLERAKAPHCSLQRILALQLALGRDLPIGCCPHDHDCQFRPQGQPRPRGTFSWREYLAGR